MDFYFEKDDSSAGSGIEFTLSKDGVNYQLIDANECFVFVDTVAQYQSSYTIPVGRTTVRLSETLADGSTVRVHALVKVFVPTT